MIEVGQAERYNRWQFSDVKVVRRVLQERGWRVRKVTAVLLFAILGAGVPLAAAAQTTNDSARTAAQKRNARRSHEEDRARKHEMKKAQRHMGKQPRTKKVPGQTL